jgi:hypothetical protein
MSKARDELSRGVLSDSMEEPNGEKEKTDPKRGDDGNTPAVAVAVLLLPVVSFALYLWLGDVGALHQETTPPRPRLADQSSSGENHSATEMVARLEARLKTTPEDVDGWILLGRSYAYLKQMDKATHAFEMAKRLDADKVRLVLGKGAPSSAGVGTAIKVRVALATELAKRVAPEDTVFVFARAAQGPRMPLAIVRKQVRDLPMEVTLDDSQAMSPAMSLSRFSSVVLGARISKSGEAIAKSGDLEGISAPVEAATVGEAKVEIDRVVR